MLPKNYYTVIISWRGAELSLIPGDGVPNSHIAGLISFHQRFQVTHWLTANYSGRRCARPLVDDQLGGLRIDGGNYPRRG